jgi:menaquinone-9 beta-reductase
MNRHSISSDVLVVGARCAGAAAARLLAASGKRVAVLDKTAYGSDTLSTHALMRGGVIQLERWGLLDQVIAAGTPPIRKTTFHYPDGDLPIDIKAGQGIDALFAPRRTVLDPILVDAARREGTEFYFGTTVTDVVRDASGRVVGVRGHDREKQPVEARADLVIGADGMYSSMARLLDAPIEHQGRHAGSAIYAYLTGITVDGYHWYYGNQAAAGIIPTNDDAVVVFAATSTDRFRHETRHGVRPGFVNLLRAADPSLVEVVDAGREIGPLRSVKGMTGYLRQPSGPGWALVGDAGSFKDPIAAHGITDALRDAEMLARAITAPAPLDQSLAEFRRRRNQLTRPIFDLADTIGSYEWDTATVKTDLLALSKAMNVEVDAILEFDETPLAA